MFLFQQLVMSAIIGIVIGISISLPILIFATGNYIVGTLATITILFVSVAIVGFIPLLGWELGVSKINIKNY